MRVEKKLIGFAKKKAEDPEGLRDWQSRGGKNVPRFKRPFVKNRKLAKKAAKMPTSGGKGKHKRFFQTEEAKQHILVGQAKGRKTRQERAKRRRQGKGGTV